MTKPVAIFDLDGTLADNGHRQKFVVSGKKDWDAFFAAQIADTPNTAVVAIYKTLFASDDFEMLVVTARPERYREVSEHWFKINGIPLKRMIMRADGDRRSDEIIKREILAKIRQEGALPLFVVDDREAVVQMWRNEGITCLQCADHDF